MTTMVKNHNEKMMDLLKEKLNVVVRYADEREGMSSSKNYLSVNSPKKVLNLKSKKY